MLNLPDQHFSHDHRWSAQYRKTNTWELKISDHISTDRNLNTKIHFWLGSFKRDQHLFTYRLSFTWTPIQAKTGWYCWPLQCISQTLLCNQTWCKSETSLTGKQNSSKAGFTKVMYWASTCSSSLPRSLMSLRTKRTKAHKKIWMTKNNHYTKYIKREYTCI